MLKTEEDIPGDVAQLQSAGKVAFHRVFRERVDPLTVQDHYHDFRLYGIASTRVLSIENQLLVIYMN